MSRLIFSLIFLTIIPKLCLTLTLDQPQLAEESSGLEPAVIKPYISDYKEISKEFLGHLLPFQSWFLKSRFRRACGHVDVGTCPHQILAATLTVFRPVDTQYKNIMYYVSNVPCTFDVSSFLFQKYLKIRQLCSLRQNLFDIEEALQYDRHHNQLGIWGHSG